MGSGAETRLGLQKLKTRGRWGENVRLVNFLIVNIHLCEEVEQDKFKAALDKALDWVQCLPNSYIVKTTSDPNKWYVRLRQALVVSQGKFCIFARSTALKVSRPKDAPPQARSEEVYFLDAINTQNVT